MEDTGFHLIADLIGCDPTQIDSAKVMERIITEAADYANCTILNTYAHQFEPNGATVVLVLAESHIAFHSMSEHDLAYLDIFTCGSKANPYKALAKVIEVLKPQNVNIRPLVRTKEYNRKET